MNHLGGSLDPNTCYLLDRGIKTLSVRMERQCFNALKIAEFLNDHPGVESVNYPGLKNIQIGIGIGKKFQLIKILEKF